jgi:hypothetical protein
MAVFSHFAHLTGRIYDTMPENMDSIMEKNGTF